MVTWPAVPVVARAYQDQLLRDDEIDAGLSRELAQVLDRAERLLEADNSNRNASRELSDLAEQFEEEGESREGITRKRYLELAATVSGIAEAVR
jgi:hypothetical protein